MENQEYQDVRPTPISENEPPVLPPTNTSNEIPPMKPTSWLWQSIVATLLCCLPFGIVGIIFAAKVDSLYNNGRYAESVKASKNAKTWTLVAVVAALIYYTILIAMFATGNLPDYMESILENSSSYNY